MKTIKRIITVILCFCIMIGLSLPVSVYAEPGNAAEKTEEKVVRVGWYESPFKVTVSLKEMDGKVPEERGQGDHAEKTEEKDLSGLRVLIAEDMLVNAQLLEAILDSKGVAHDRAENGKLAVDCFRESAPGYYDVILMDIQMPEMNVLEATAAIRAMDKEDAKTIPIIAMTANAFDEDVKRSLQAGMNTHLTKPIEIERLFELLSRME